TPALLNRMTGRSFASPSVTLGSQLSRPPRKCCRKMTGVPVAAPSLLYAYMTPSAPTTRVFAVLCVSLMAVPRCNTLPQMTVRSAGRRAYRLGLRQLLPPSFWRRAEPWHRPGGAPGGPCPSRCPRATYALGVREAAAPWSELRFPVRLSPLSCDDT